MLNQILRTIKWDRDLPMRSRMIDLYTRVYNGTLYDHLRYFYFQERQGNGGAYIPLHQRQPSVKANFCKVVTDDSVSLLFGGDHFPSVTCEDAKLRSDLEDIIRFYELNKIMIRAATIGSTGSVVLLLKVFDGVLKLEPKNTKYFYPVFDEKDNDKLSQLTEKYKVKGELLIAQGYQGIEKPAAMYWFHRVWTETSEIFYVPYLCEDKNPKIRQDKERSHDHNFGFVPAVWIRNLEQILDFDEEGVIVDGACTFKPAIDTNIEIDYQLSQAGRALKYSADPLLVLKIKDDFTLQGNMQPVMDEASGALLNDIGGGVNRKLIRSASNALTLGEDDEASLLEISGKASEAVVAYVRYLREILVESIHGNRSHADKVSSAQSAASQKEMNQSLIWLADRLRVSYGDPGFLKVLHMIIAITNCNGYFIVAYGKPYRNLNKNEKIGLGWPSWYPNTPSDMVAIANASKSFSDAGMLSKETGTKNIAQDFSIENIKEEMTRIDQDQKKIIAQQETKLARVQNI